MIWTIFEHHLEKTSPILGCIKCTVKLQITLPQTTFFTNQILELTGLDCGTRKPWCTVTSFTQTLSTGFAGCQPTIISLQFLKTNMSPEKWLQSYLPSEMVPFQGTFVNFSEGYSWRWEMSATSETSLKKTCHQKNIFSVVRLKKRLSSWQTIEENNFGSATSTFASMGV